MARRARPSPKIGPHRHQGNRGVPRGQRSPPRCRQIKAAAMCRDIFEIDPLGYLSGIAKTKDEVIELTSEVLTDTLKLTHPDHHPPERQALAHHVTRQLLALQPFVFPTSKPKVVTPTPQHNEPVTFSAEVNKKSSQAYPCQKCADTAPYWYCTACRAEYDRRRRVDLDKENAGRRALRAKMRLLKPPATCVECKTTFKPTRKDARFCTPRCRQRSHRNVTDK
jgi:hypothetical protein